MVLCLRLRRLCMCVALFWFCQLRCLKSSHWCTLLQFAMAHNVRYVLHAAGRRLFASLAPVLALAIALLYGSILWCVYSTILLMSVSCMSEYDGICMNLDEPVPLFALACKFSVAAVMYMPVPSGSTVGRVGIRCLDHAQVVFGGFYEAVRESKWFNDLWLFDFQTEKWIQIDFPPTAMQPACRSGHQV
jgi:hypothetical protein